MTPFLPRHVKDLAGDVSEAPDWLVHGLVPQGVLALLAAYPKVGKSTFAGQLTIAVAQEDKPFLGRSTKQGGVLLIVAEEMKDDVMRRLRHLGMDESKDPIYLWTEGVEDTSADREKLRKFIQENNIVLVIIDTLASYLMLEDETNNSAVTRRLKPYVDMAHSTGTTILFVHHERKNREEGADDARAIRGGGAILGLADISYQLQREPSGGTRRRLKIVGRYSEIPRSLTLDYVEDEYACLGTPEEAGRAAQREKVLAALPASGLGLTAKEIATKTKVREKAVRTALSDAHGSAGCSGAGKKGDPFRYVRLPEATDTPLGSLIDEVKERETAEV